jgi:CheY-like chemotaxis protein
VLFTDVQMTGALDGLELAREVARRYPHVSRLVTSGRMQPTSGDDDPCYRFLPKPYRPQEVVKSIREMLGAGASAPTEMPRRRVAAASASRVPPQVRPIG